LNAAFERLGEFGSDPDQSSDECCGG
jgi:hypothetical protein